MKNVEYNTNITKVENKIPSVNGLVTTSALNAKTATIENKIPDITNQYTKAAEVESTIPDITNVALNAKTTKIENIIPNTTAFITTPEFTKLTKRRRQEVTNLERKSEIDPAFNIADKNGEFKKTSNFLFNLF